LAIISEERGRGLQPGPFVSMNVVAATLADSGSPDQQASVLSAVCRGDVLATWVLGNTCDYSTDAPITAVETANGFELSGIGTMVEDGASADWLLVTAASQRGPSQFLLATDTVGLTMTPLVGHDVTRRLASVTLNRVSVPTTSLVGGWGQAADDIEHQFQLACVLSVAETVGALDVLFEMTRTYALDRTAFGRPIGSFQAVKHQLANMSLSLECGKAVVAASVRAVQAGAGDAGEIVSMAKSWMGDTGIDIAQGCFQVFGGIGYTWEHDLHLFLRRITTNGILFGQSDWHRERICRIHGL
jgi:alkylation response protein AidB-like acyl-CoA dehydrogenase